MKYLLIDDNPIDLMVNEKVIINIDRKNEVIQKRSGPEALSYINDSDNSLPDVVLLDIKMPLMDGFQFLEELAKQNLAALQKMTVYLVSSSIDPFDQKRSSENPHIKAFLKKPLNRRELEKEFQE